MNKNYILVAVAMRIEAKPLIEKLENVKKDCINSFDFYIGQINNKDIIIGISNIGIVNMSSMISIAISNYNIDRIINYGLSGGYGDVKRGSIIVGKECMNINSYLTNYSEIVNIENLNFITFKEDEDYEIIAELVIYKANESILTSLEDINQNNVIFGKIGSGDVWNKEIEKIDLLYNKYNILCEDMESVAIYQLADRFNIPAISIRGISNNELLNQEYDPSVSEMLVDYIYRCIK